jgi:hypothetical protein
MHAVRCQQQLVQGNVQFHKEIKDGAPAVSMSVYAARQVCFAKNEVERQKEAQRKT